MRAFKPKSLRIYRFHPERLDPIAVYVEQFAPESSRMTVQCYARAWTAYWGSHGSKGLESFIVSCHPSYVADSLTWGTNGFITKRMEKRNRDYLVQIVQAIQAEFSKLSGGAA